MLNKPLALSSEFQEALRTFEHSHNHVFVTGRAGTGKSTLLNLFRKTTKQKVVVLAPTGIAALNVKGQTIHSFFGFPPRIIDIHELKIRRSKQLFKRLDIIIIDEISMVRADIIDNIDVFLQRMRDSSEPFGGVKMIFFGDLFQLPPVIASPTERAYFRERYESPYFFSSDVIKYSVELDVIQLNKVYRQDEKYFIRILDNIRTRHFDEDDLESLNQRATSPEPDLNYITLTSRNDTAFRINEEELKKIDMPPTFFNATVTGEFNPKLYPTEASLQLKLGAQVMFVKNDPDKQFVNGTIGKIVVLDSEHLKVQIRDDQGEPKIINVEPLEWEILRYALEPEDKNRIKSKVIGTFKQYPVKLAWAITIHKSQGKSFNHVIIDLGKGAFESGQTYVALSRCRKLDGIVLRNKLTPRDIIVDPRIVEFSEHLRYNS